MKNTSTKSSLSNGTKSTKQMTVRFQLDESNQTFDEPDQNKSLTRKRSAESLVIHEIQPWSSLISTFPSFSLSSDTKSQSSSSDNPFLEEVIVHPSPDRSRSPLINPTKQRDSHHDQFTCGSLAGTMSQIHYLLTHKRFLRKVRCCKTLILFIDACLRGIGQVMFANNPLSGLMIIAALWITDIPCALYALLGTMMSTLTALLLGLNSESIQTGLYGSNGCLTALIIAHFSFGRTFLQLIGPIIILSIASTIFFLALAKILVVRFDLSPFTFSSQLCSLIWFLGACKIHSISFDEALSLTEISSSIVNLSNQSNGTLFWSSLSDTFVGFFTGISHVYFIHSVLAGVIILFGISICSPRLAILALFGSIIGQLTAMYLFRIPFEEIREGVWSYNSVLTCQTLAGMFFVLHGYQIWFYTLFGSIMTVLLQYVLHGTIPPLMLPSIFICWLFCLIGGSSRYLIGVKLRSMSIPEDHLRRFRLSSLVKKHFQFLDHLSVILDKVGANENISIEELSCIEAEFVPILLCSYTHQNDLANLKSLLNEGADVNSTDYDLRSPLHLAACDGNLKLCRILIERFRANPNLSDDFGGTPLYDAFCHGHLHLIPYLYAKGARMPMWKMKELTFLLCAFSYEGNFEAVQYLIASGMNPNLTDHYGRTALHLAVCGNHFSIVKYLVEEANVSLSTRDYYGHTSLDDALQLSDQEIAFYLQHRRNDPLESPMKVFNLFAEDLSDDVDDRIDIEDDLDDDEPVVKSALLSTEESLLPALFCTAAGEGNVRQMINILKQFPRFRSDSVDYDFRSAAHIAAAEGQLASIQFLCKHSLSKKQDLHWINREDRWGFTAIEEAYRNGHLQVADLLKEYQSKDSTSIQLEMGQNSSFTTKSFVDSIRKWKKVLRFAMLVSNNEAELIKSLLMSGIFSSTETYADYDGRTPMHWAALNGYLDVVKVLQQCGDDGRTHQDRWNNSALDEAKRKKFTQIVHILQDDIV